MQQLSGDSEGIAGSMAPDRRRVSRSRVSNGSEFLPNIDGRSATARRMRDIVEDFKGHLGGNVSVAQEVIIRRCAALASLAEAQEAAHVAGEKTLDVTTYIPIVNALRRLVADLGLAPAMKDATSLHDYLTSNSAPVEAPTDIEEHITSTPPRWREGKSPMDTEVEVASPLDEPEEEGAPALKPGDVIELWPGAILLVDDSRPPRYWITRSTEAGQHPLEYRHSEEAARQRAEVLRARGQL